jgi:hypothetical protein
MTKITFQGGKVVMRDGKVGTEQGCCCGCDCNCFTVEPGDGEWSQEIDSCIVAGEDCEFFGQNVNPYFGVTWADNFLATHQGCKLVFQTATGVSGYYFRLWKCVGDSFVDVSESAFNPLAPSEPDITLGMGGSAGTGAVLTATVTANGTTPQTWGVSAVTVDDGGSGYTDGEYLTVTLGVGDEISDGYELAAYVITDGAGSIQSVVVESAGRYYKATGTASTFLENGWWCRDGSCDETPDLQMPKCKPACFDGCPCEEGDECSPGYYCCDGVCRDCVTCEGVLGAPFPGYEFGSTKPAGCELVGFSRSQTLYSAGLPVESGLTFKEGYPDALVGCSWYVSHDVAEKLCFASGCDGLSPTACVKITKTRWRVWLHDCESTGLTDVTADAVNGETETTTDDGDLFGCDKGTYVCSDQFDDYFDDPYLDCDP